MNTSTIKKTLLLTLVCLVGFTTNSIAKGKKYALFVGINAYTGDLLKVVVKVTDKAGNPVNGAAVGIFNQGVPLGRGQIESSSARALGKTNTKGIYVPSANDPTTPSSADSPATNIQALLLPRGTYFIKVIRDGYEPYIGEVKVEENTPGYCVLVVNLQKQ